MSRRRYIGVVFAALFLSLIGVAPALVLVFLLLIIGGTGSAALHPTGTTIAGGPTVKNRALGVGFFTACATSSRATLLAMSVPLSVDPNDHDRFILRQRLRLVVNQYEFSLPEADGEMPGEAFCFVRQRMFKFKEDIRFYADESQSVELMRIKARQRLDPRARYDVTAADGSKIGEIQKVFGASLVRSTYRLFDATGQEVASATERSLVVALFRRLVGFVPYIENVANWLPIPYHFVFLRDGAELGSHRRHLGKLRDVYTIDLSGDPDRTVDRRLILAIAVGMDALQAR